jgi:hypothetical protein
VARLDLHTKASVLWGAVSGLSFLVLAQGYELVGDLGIGFGTVFVVALFVAVLAAGLTYSMGR